MDIDLPVTWTDPGSVQTGTVTVTYTETLLKEGYHVRTITSIAWPTGYPKDQQMDLEKPLYHLLNEERQKVVIDTLEIDVSPK